MRLEPNPQLPTEGEAMRRRLFELIRSLNITCNALSETTAAARYAAVTVQPTTGTYSIGDYVSNKTPAKLGTAGSRYVVAGWTRLTNGAAHVAFTDWVEDRRLTGD